MDRHDTVVEQGQRWLDGRMEFTVVEVRGDEVEVKYLDDPSGVHSWHNRDRFEEFEQL